MPGELKNTLEKRIIKLALLVLTAGVGSRYGGLRQLDGLGPGGETIVGYSIFDTIRGGFSKLVFVIHKSFEKDLREKITSKYENRIPIKVVFQDLNNFPEGFTCLKGREKLWGTNHAILMDKKVINEPFVVINADDFYGRDSFIVLGKQLSEMDGKKNDYCVVGYRVGNTLSESGSIARDVCATNEEGYLIGVVERTTIKRIDGDIQFIDENGEKVVLEENTPVSVNMWGFIPDYFRYSEGYFKEFLKANMGNLRSEYFIPLMVNRLITEGTARVKVLDTTSRWFDVAYVADHQGVVDKIQALVDAGEYPSKLF